MKNLIQLTLILFIFSGIHSNVNAQSESITFINEKGETKKIDLSILKVATVKAIGHDKKTHEYSGPLLYDFLRQAGVKLGEPAKRQNLTNYILIRAKDNYKCMYAMAEIDPLFSTSSIIIANKIDGKALSENNGPFQIIAPKDKIHGRWVRQVKSIEFHNLP